MAETFFATLECGLLARATFRTHAEARRAVFAFIEGFYNPRRRHSSLGYLSPVDYERSHGGNEHADHPDMVRNHRRRRSSKRIQQRRGKTLQGVQLAMFVCPYLVFAMAVFWILAIALTWGALEVSVELRELVWFFAGISAFMGVAFTVKLRQCRRLMSQINTVARLREVAPNFFEHCVAKLLRRHGLMRIAVRGAGGDRGVDVLGYAKGMKVVVQCKRYAADHKVTSPEMQKFVGALQIERAARGLFVTTSTFTAEAKAKYNFD